MAVKKNNRESLSAGDITQYALAILGVIVGAFFLWIIKDALLIAFAGIILAVILSGLANKLQLFVPISRNWSIATVGIVLTILIVSFGFLFGSQIAGEFEELTEQLPQQISQLQDTIREWPMGEQLVGDGKSNNSEEGGNGDDMEGVTGDMAGEAGGLIFQLGVTFVDVISTLFLIIIVGIFFASDPDVYKKGFILLFTKKRANRISEALEASGNALWYWLTGQFIAMSFVGISITIGLMIIGVPLSFILGFIAGVFDFVPVIGPIAAAVPALLLAFSEGTQTALYTLILYVVVQQLETNVVTPLIQNKMVSIPPALIILAVVAFGLVFGIAGIILATPLAVVVMVFVGIFYVQDVLGKKIFIPGKD